MIIIITFFVIIFVIFIVITIDLTLGWCLVDYACLSHPPLSLKMQPAALLLIINYTLLLLLINTLTMNN